MISVCIRVICSCLQISSGYPWLACKSALLIMCSKLVNVYIHAVWSCLPSWLIDQWLYIRTVWSGLPSSSADPWLASHPRSFLSSSIYPLLTCTSAVLMTSSEFVNISMISKYIRAVRSSLPFVNTSMMVCTSAQSDQTFQCSSTDPWLAFTPAESDYVFHNERLHPVQSDLVFRVPEQIQHWRLHPCSSVMSSEFVNRSRIGIYICANWWWSSFDHVYEQRAQSGRLIMFVNICLIYVIMHIKAV